MLVTLAIVKAYIGPAADNDGLIDLIIPGVQAIVEKYCGRNFDVKSYEGEQHNINHKIFPKHTPIISVENITRLNSNIVDTAPDTNVIANYRVFPGYVELMDYKYVTMGNKLKYVNSEETYVEVSYTAGYENIPADLSLTILKMIALEYKAVTQDTAGLTSYGEGGIKETYASDGMSPSIKSALDRYKRVCI